MLFFHFLQIPIESSVGKQRRSWSDTAFCAVSDLSLHCLPMSHKKDTRLVWVYVCGGIHQFIKGQNRKHHIIMLLDLYVTHVIRQRNPSFYQSLEVSLQIKYKS